VKSMETPRRSRRVWWLLMVLPVWLLASGGGALWYYFFHERQQAAIEEQRFVQTVSVPRLADDLQKFISVIGERNASSETAAVALSRTASMIEGLLGPGNTGYAVTRHRGPAAWPILAVTIKGKNTQAAGLWVVTSYDSPVGSLGVEANATGLAATLAAAQALAADTPAAAIHFVFLPHANDLESPVIATLAKFAELVKVTEGASALLCVEAMGAGESLWLSSRETAATPLNFVKGLGEVHGAADVCLSDDSDLTSGLFELNLPAVRVATRAHLAAAEADDKPPFPATVAAATGRLIELIRRCAGPAKTR
jgi:hypothetical protein